MADIYLLAMRCPVQRRRDSHPGFRTELENLAGDAKGKGTRAETPRPKVPMHRPGADSFVVVMKRGIQRRALFSGVGRRRAGKCLSGTVLHSA